MKKLLKRLGIIAILGGTLYVSYLLFIVPNGFDSKEELLTSYIFNINDSDTCDSHFNSETTSICEVLQTEFEDKDVVFDKVFVTTSGLRADLMVDELPIQLDFTFVTYEPSGLRKYFSNEYYLIDTVE